jgi:hypothetical protein
MSEQLIQQDADMKEFDSQKPPIIKRIILYGTIFLIIAIIIIILVVLFSRAKKSKDESKESEYADLEHEIITVQFPPDIKYIGSHYNYDGYLLLTYQKNNSENYFVGIATDEGKLLKEILEVKKGDLDPTYIHRASSFSDGKRVLIGGKILECEKPLLECDDAKLIDLEFPEQLKNLPNLLLLFTEPIINYGGKHIFWSTFDKDMNIFNFVGELKRENDKYIIENIQGLTNYFYDLYDREKGTYSLPKILKFGPIKQVVRGGEGLSIGGFLDYGLRKGIYQSLSEDKLSQLTFFEGYDETTAISPDSKIACVMTTRFSDSTSLEIIGLIPTPYSILASYLFSVDALNYIIFNLRVNKPTKGNLGPTLVDLKKVNEDKNYKGFKLKTEDLWIFNGFISWAPDGTKVMFDEIYKGTNNRRCQVVKLKKYKPQKIEFKNNFNGKVPYARSIEETINMHLDYPININLNGKSGNLQIFRNETKCEITYNNFSEDNEVFYNGTYYYEKFTEEKYIIFQVDIKSEGKKNGYCNYRLWFDMTDEIFLFDKAIDGNDKTYGDCKYEGKEINVTNYK